MPELPARDEGPDKTVGALRAITDHIERNTTYRTRQLVLSEYRLNEISRLQDFIRDHMRSLSSDGSFGDLVEIVNCLLQWEMETMETNSLNNKSRNQMVADVMEAFNDV